MYILTWSVVLMLLVMSFSLAPTFAKATKHERTELKKVALFLSCLTAVVVSVNVYLYYVVGPTVKVTYTPGWDIVTEKIVQSTPTHRVRTLEQEAYCDVTTVTTYTSGAAEGDRHTIKLSGTNCSQARLGETE